MWVEKGLLNHSEVNITCLDFVLRQHNTQCDLDLFIYFARLRCKVKAPGCRTLSGRCYETAETRLGKELVAKLDSIHSKLKSRRSIG